MSRNYLDDKTKMRDLVEGFHVLGPGTPGARPWNDVAFFTWAKKDYGVMSSGEQLAVSFVHDVYGARVQGIQPFDLNRALQGAWDDRNLLHALAWLDANVGTLARQRSLVWRRPASPLSKEQREEQLARRGDASEALQRAMEKLRASGDQDLAEALDHFADEVAARVGGIRA